MRRKSQRTQRDDRKTEILPSLGSVLWRKTGGGVQLLTPFCGIIDQKYGSCCIRMNKVMFLCL